MKFEYKIESYKKIKKNPQQYLDRLGAEAWELVAVTPVGLKLESRHDIAWGDCGGVIRGDYEDYNLFFKRCKAE